jgi:hypothetical protein
VTDDDVASKLARLLDDPPPRPRRRPKIESFSSTPIGFALTAFDLALDLVDAANHAEALADWEERQNRVRRWRSVLSAGPVDGTSRKVVESLQRTCVFESKSQWDRTARLCEWMAAATRRVTAIVDFCREREAAIRAAAEADLGQVPAADNMAAQRRVMAAARHDDLANCRAACEQIDTETRGVLLLHKRTAAISLTDLYAMVAQRN